MEEVPATTRPRADSAAAQREARELRKEQRLAEDARRAATSRFARPQRKDAKSNEALPEHQQDVEANSQQQDVEAKNQQLDGEVDKQQLDPESDEENQEKDPRTAALVVNPSRAQRKLRAGDVAIDEHRNQRFTIRPEPLSVNSSARSKLVADCQLQKAAGVFVEMVDAPSRSLVRMEQRLLRESETSNQRPDVNSQQAMTDTDGRTARLLSMLAGDTADNNGSDTEDNGGEALQFIGSNVSESKPLTKAAPAPSPVKQPTTRIAWLQITVSRVELDDHALFSMSDRLSAQLRVLISTYAQHHRQRGWELPLQRVKAFVAHAVDPAAAPSLHASVTTLATSIWARETQRDAECALQSLHELQQLHLQILQKWEELQALESNGFGRPEIQCETFFSLFSLSVKKRAEPIALDVIQALIEVLTVGKAVSNTDLSQTNISQDEGIATLSSKFRNIRTVGANQAIDSVLEIKKRVESAPERRRVSNYPANAPQFYVSIYVNGRLACRTQPQTWAEASTNSDVSSSGVTAGVIVFNETFRLRLPNFPASVSARVFELRGIASKVLPLGFSWTDESLSARPVSLIVPGSEEQREVASYASTQKRRHYQDNQLDAKRNDGNRNHGITMIPAASVGASHEWYQFCAAVDLPRSRWHRSMLDSPSMAVYARRVQGRIGISVAWTPCTGQHAHLNGSTDAERARLSAEGDADIPFLPPPQDSVVELSTSARPKTRASMYKSSVWHWSSPPLVGPSYTNRTEGELSAGFARSHQFQKHLAPEHLSIDTNDPANIRISRIQQLFMADQAISPLLSGVFRSFPDNSVQAEQISLTKRNQLLHLRHLDRSRSTDSPFSKGSNHRQRLLNTSRAVLLEEPVPLLDTELLENEVYLRLLRPELRAFDHELLRHRAESVDTSEQSASRWTLLRRHEYQRVLIVEFLDREKKAQRRFASESSAPDNNNAAGAISQSKPAYALSAIIQEQPLPLFPGTLELPSLGDLFARRRKLRPRVQRASVVATAISSAHWPTHCELYIQIQRATNIPLRIMPKVGNGDGSNLANALTPRRLRRQKEAARRLTRLGGDDGSDDSEPTPPDTPRNANSRSLFSLESRVFVEVSFQGRARRTTCALVSKQSRNSSANASVEWMETLVLPFHPPGDDWNPVSLADVNDIVNIRIYDRIIRADNTTDSSTPLGVSPSKRLHRGEAKDREGTTLPRQGKRSFHEEHCLLGSLRIPFSAIYRAHGIVDSSMRCRAPVEHLGYANINQEDHIGSALFDSTVASSAESLTVDNQQQDLAHEEDESSEVTGIDRLVKRSERDVTHLHVMMTLNPLLPRPPVPSSSAFPRATTMSKTTIRTSSMILRDASQWIHEMGLFSSIVVWLMDRGPVLLTQLLGPQTPPPGLTTAMEVAHFVHCLPHFDDWRTALNLMNDFSDAEQQTGNNSEEIDGIIIEERSKKKTVWCASQQCLDLCGGDRHEHAVLLCNYLLWLDQLSSQGENERSKTGVYLVFGTTITTGDEAVLVLHQGASSSRKGGILWDTSTGVGYHLSSETCPLRQVLLVVSSENVFVNVQGFHPCERRQQFNWDIEKNPKSWKPLIGNGVSVSDRSLLPSLQPRELAYTITPREYVEQIERELMDALKLSIRRWRSSHSTTVFNMNAGLKLRSRLEQLELQLALRLGTNAVTSRNTGRRMTVKKREESSDGLQMSGDFLSELLRSHDLAGVPIHMPFTDIPRVVSAVQEANVHETTRPGVEFILSVYARGYPNGVVSVWVYLASMAARG